MILNSLQNGPLVWPTVVEKNGITRTKKYEELSIAEKLQADCDLKATNIVLQGLPPDVYDIVNHHKVAKEIWDRVKLLMQSMKLSLQEKECKLYDGFNKQVQVNTKFLNSLPPEWSKFVTDVKLARDLHTTNYDQLYSYLEQHEAHANETHLMHERYQDPLIVSHQTSSVPPIAYNTPQSLTQPLTEFPQMELGLVVLVFNQGDDPIACLNKVVAFLTAVASSRFPSTTNQLRTSSNLRNQATIQDGRVTVKQVQGKQGQSYTSIVYKGNATSSRGNNAGGQTRVVKCYNCQGDGHIARQCTQPKRTRNAACYKEKAIRSSCSDNHSKRCMDLDAYDSDCDDVSNAKAVLMANLSKYGSDVISEVPHVEPYHTYMDDQSVHAMQSFEQTPVVDFTDNEITSDSNIIIKHGASLVIDDEETLILEEVKLFDEQAFYLQTLHPNTDQSASSPVKIEAPKELPTVSLVNTSLKKLKYHLSQFDIVVKKRITPDAITEGE
ncbi:retrovirus-related pol polyprotein from transposon TNT 1-94 [Tanacetum coccineum]